MSSRRRVTVDQALFEALDRQLPPERSAQGAPSTGDFLVLELPTIIDEFAEHFDSMPLLITERPDYRVLVSFGILVRASVTIGQLRPDDSVVLLDIELEVAGPPVD